MLISAGLDSSEESSDSGSFSDDKSTEISSELFLDDKSKKILISLI
jgi:hypothetical protein